MQMGLSLLITSRGSSGGGTAPDTPFAFTDNADGTIDVTTEGTIPTPTVTTSSDGKVSVDPLGAYIFKPTGNAEDDMTGAVGSFGSSAPTGAGTFKTYARIAQNHVNARATYYPSELGSKLFSWYDFKDMSAQYQSNDFTNPVTATGQSILSIADKGGQGSGNNRGLIVNGNDASYDANGYLTLGASHSHLEVNVPEQMTDDTTIYIMMDCAATAMMPFVKEGGVQSQGFAGLAQDGNFSTAVESGVGSSVTYAKGDPLTTFAVSNRDEMHTQIATTPGTFQLFAIRGLELATPTSSGDDISYLGRALDGFGAMTGSFTDIVTVNQTLTAQEELLLVEFMSGRAS